MKHRDRLLANAYLLAGGEMTANEFLLAADEILGDDIYPAHEWRALGEALDPHAWPGETRVETFMRMLRATTEAETRSHNGCDR